MRLGKQKSICIRIFPAHIRPQWSRVNKLLILWLIFLIVALATTAFYRRIANVVELVAGRHATNLAVRLIHEAVNEQMIQNGFEYADFVVLHKGDSGEIRSITINAATVNRLKAEIALLIEKKVSGMTDTSVQIPYTAFFSDDLAVGHGPRWEFELAPTGYCFIDFENSFSEAGINQTKHQVDIVIKANFTMMTAVGGEGVTVQTNIPVAQTVIVGTVPNSYFEIQK